MLQHPCLPSELNPLLSACLCRLLARAPLYSVPPRHAAPLLLITPALVFLPTYFVHVHILQVPAGRPRTLQRVGAESKA